MSLEGVLGIARSFLAARARSVIATLWPISDDARKKFMEVFNGKLLLETSVCEALKTVMNMRGEYRSYLIWTPFTLYEEDAMFTRKIK